MMTLLRNDLKTSRSAFCEVFTVRTFLVAALPIMSWSCTSHPDPSLPEDLTQPYEYDARAPIAIRELGRDVRAAATIIDVRFPSALGGEVPAWLVLPRASEAPHPLVLYGHWMMPGSPLRNRGEFLEEALVLAGSGAAALLIDAPRVRPEAIASTDEMADLDLDAKASRQAVVDYRRALDLLVRRPDIDSTRIAFVGHSFNAHVGGILAAVDKRVGSFVLMAGAFADERYVFDTTNAAMVAFRSRHGDAAVREFFAQHRWDDPVHFIGRTGPAAVFLQFGTRDDAIPPALSNSYYADFGEPKEIGFYDAGHELNAAARVARAQWLVNRLRLRAVDTSALNRIAPLR